MVWERRLLEKIKRAIGSDYDQNKLCKCDCYLWLSTSLHLQLTKVNRLYKLVRNFFIELFGVRRPILKQYLLRWEDSP